MVKNFFKLDEHETTVSKELLAGATTFFAMVYIIFVNPSMLSETGMPWGAVFLATIFATVIGTLFMGLFANVPYALAPGMGLNAFFTFVICIQLKFTWQEALGLVFICGIINIIITVTKVRKMIIKAIPESLQHAIGGGIGIFIAYIGLKNSGLLSFTADPGHWSPIVPGLPFDQTGMVADSTITPSLVNFSNAVPALATIGLIITVVLLLLKVKGAILIGIVATALIGALPVFGLTSFANLKFDIIAPFKELPQTFFAAFDGIGSLFSSGSKLLISFMAIFAFSITDTFDTIGTFIGTGRRSGIFSDQDLQAIETHSGFNTKMEKALFADSIATSIGALLGTSNTTTYVESSAGIEAGGRTGLTSVFTALLFFLCIFISPIVGIVPSAATAPALIVVGIMMLASFKEISWDQLEEAVPAFFAGVLMALAYSISTGIALGFIFYIIVKVSRQKAKEIHPVLWVTSALFVVYFVFMALIETNIVHI